MSISSTISAEPPSLPAPTRRDFLYIATATVAAVGAGATVWPLIDQMNPDAATQAANSAIDVDISQVQPGQQIVVLWGGRPVFVVNRTQAALDTLRDPAVIARLSDPNSTMQQQASYAANWHRSINPEYLVLLGICTHLGCVPTYTPKPDPKRSRAQLARRLSLSLSRLEIRPRRPGLPRRSRALQPPGAAVSFPRRQDVADRRKPARFEFRLRLDPAGVKTAGRAALSREAARAP